MPKISARRIAALAVFGALAGCVAREPAGGEVVSQSMPIRTPERSYLDAGPAPAAGGGPNYVRDTSRGPLVPDDRYGAGILPTIP